MVEYLSGGRIQGSSTSASSPPQTSWKLLDRTPLTSASDTIAVSLAEERDTIEDVIEPYLIQQGFLMRSPRGRVLTSRAFSHLNINVPENVNQLDLGSKEGLQDD